MLDAARIIEFVVRDEPSGKRFLEPWDGIVGENGVSENALLLLEAAYASRPAPCWLSALPQFPVKLSNLPGQLVYKNLFEHLCAAR